MPRIQLPDDERTDAFRQQIDRCECHTVRLYVESPESKIQAAFVVDHSLRIELAVVVAATGDVTTMIRLLQSGPVRPVDDLSRIADHTAYCVNYLEPAYLVQFANRTQLSG